MNPAGVLISRTWSTGRLRNLLANLLGTRTDDPYLPGCMGHQCIGQAFGGMVPWPDARQNLTSDTSNKGVLKGLTVSFQRLATHSLVRRGLPRVP
jgi:anthranilate/para-aminobenzoate synthase component II